MFLSIVLKKMKPCSNLFSVKLDMYDQKNGKVVTLSQTTSADAAKFVIGYFIPLDYLNEFTASEKVHTSSNTNGIC